jgi:hypothetical protein
MKPYDATAMSDGTGEAHWMFVFDEHENRIDCTRNGIQRMADLEIDSGKFIDLDQIESQIRAAIEKLIVEQY